MEEETTKRPNSVSKNIQAIELTLTHFRHSRIRQGEDRNFWQKGQFSSSSWSSFVSRPVLPLSFSSMLIVVLSICRMINDAEEKKKRGEMAPSRRFSWIMCSNEFVSLPA